MIYGSVCSGIEAASVAWHPLGWKAAWLAEIEPFPSAVLAHHYPDTPNLGDMTKISAKVLTGDVVAPDVLVGGTPCQAFSVAGLREGLNDGRGQLTIKYMELANAIDFIRQRRGEEPAVIVWENVPGVLSDKTNAFGCFLAGLAGESVELKPAGGKWSNAGCVFGPQRTVAWRVLDAQYFGVAQRRRRVFVVASAREGFDPAAVLFEFEGVRRDSAPSREAGEGSAGGAGAGAAFGGNNTAGPIDVATARNACASASGRMDFESETFLVQPAICVHGNQDPCVSEHTAFALGRNNGGENAIAFSCNDHGGDAGPISPALRSMGHDVSHANAGGQVAVALPFGTTQITISANRSNPKYGDPCHPLAAGAHAPAIAVQASQSGVRFNDTIGTLDANYGSRRHNGVMQAMQVRRLTPVECERLQGFPDGYTMIPWRKKPAEDCPDGPRYKALGNSMAVPCMFFIGSRINAAVSTSKAAKKVCA